MRYHIFQKFIATCSAIFCIYDTHNNIWEAKEVMLTPHLTPPFHSLMWSITNSPPTYRFWYMVNITRRHILISTLALMTYIIWRQTKFEYISDVLVTSSPVNLMHFCLAYIYDIKCWIIWGIYIKGLIILI